MQISHFLRTTNVSTSQEKTLKKQIVDKKRIKIILKKIRLKSKAKKIDPIITRSIWKSMINAFISYEYRNFKKK